MRQFVYVLLVLVIVLFVSSLASAAVVNMTTGETLFYDTFQGLGSAVSHAGYPDPGGSYNPVAMSSPPSAWAIRNEDALGQQVQVTDRTASPDVGPAPDYGPNYLRIARVGSPGYTEAEAQFVGQTTTGDHIRMAFWLNVARPGDCAEVNLYSANGGLVSQWVTDYQGAWVWASGNGNAGFDDVFKDRVWQKWVFDYNVNDPTYTLSIDGVSKTLNISPCNLGSIAFSQGGQSDPANALYVGEVAVPEPASMILVVSGVASLLAYAWRRRK
jgi:hypothetical protein